MTFALIQTVHVKTTLELHCSFLPFQKGHREETERINIKQFKQNLNLLIVFPKINPKTVMYCPFPHVS